MAKRENSGMITHSMVNPELFRDVARFGAKDIEICMQCGICSASCPLSTGTETFPRKIYRYLQLGLIDKLRRSAVPWLCYYCGECNKDCPRGAEPAETMMAARRWLTTQYDRTGLARRLYLSTQWEIGALGAVALGIVLLFVLFHGPVVTDRVSVDTFAPVAWIEIGDLLMAGILTTFLLSNALRMFRWVMGDTKVPFRLYISEARAFALHFATQKRWRECGRDRSRWLKHFTLVTGYMTMMTLVIVFIRWFQVDDSSWHFTSLFGYYATGVLLFITVEMFRSRLKKQEAIHRFSELSDWLFLILLFFTTLTGIIMHLLRIAGWPMGTYVSYVVHLAIAVPMLVIEVPFGKWSHLFYRPLAVFLATVKAKAEEASHIEPEDIVAEVGEAFMSCIHCGTCMSLCPGSKVSTFNPRRVMRRIAMETVTAQSVDQAAWRCVTCNSCGVNCPRGIDIIDVMRTLRELQIGMGKIPEHLEEPLDSLRHRGNPWVAEREKRLEWGTDLDIPAFTLEHEYALFTCCTSAYDSGNRSAARALPELLVRAGIAFGALGTEQSCCGDPAKVFGADQLYSLLERQNTELISGNGAAKVLTSSPHCLNAFKKDYPALKGTVSIAHYTELLDRLLGEGRLRPVQEVACVATYHDPCYLGRHNGIYEAPRRVLNHIPGLTLVEMPNNRELSLCCGGGGGGAWGVDSSRQPMGVMRVREALGTGADVIATACPYCLRMLNAAVATMGVGDRITVQDIAEVMIQSLEKTQETDTAEAVGAGVEREVIHA